MRVINNFAIFITIFLGFFVFTNKGTSFAEVANEVSIICDLNKDVLFIVYNDAIPSDKISSQAIIKSYNLYDYVVYGKDNNPSDSVGYYVQEIKKIEYNCKLRSKIYSIYIEPYLYNNNPMGECGADITCSVIVKEKDRPIVQEEYLELSCPPGSLFKIKQILVSGKDGKVTIEQIPETAKSGEVLMKKKPVVVPKKAN